MSSERPLDGVKQFSVLHPYFGICSIVPLAAEMRWLWQYSSARSALPEHRGRGSAAAARRGPATP